MPYTNFVTGSEVPAAFFNAIKKPVMDGAQEDGHGDKIIDDWLSDDPTHIKARFGALNNSLLVAAATGRNVNVQGGAVTLEDNTIAAINSTSLGLPADAVSFIWVSQAGVVEFGSKLPVRCLPLARVTTLANSIAVNGLVDLRPRFRVAPVPRSLSAFGGASAQDITISVNTVVTSAIRCRNFTLAAGVTLSAPSGLIEIFASGDVNIAGIVTVSPPVAGAAGFSGSVGNTHYVIESGRGQGAGGGTNSPATPVYSWEASLFGSSGASGFAIATGGGNLTQSRGGNGGGSIKIFAAGAVTISGQLSARGGNAVIGFATGGTNTLLSGGGGGAGGSIVLASITSVTATAAAQLDVRGGDGAAAAVLGSTTSTGGGSGGGGGWVVSRSPANNFTGATILLTGGTAGAVVPSGVSAVAGGGGGTFAGQGGPSGATGTAGSIGQTFFDNTPPV